MRRGWPLGCTTDSDRTAASSGCVAAARQPARTSAAVAREQAAEAGQARAAARRPARPRASRTSVDGLPQVVVAAAVPSSGQVAQPGGGEVVRGSARAASAVGVRVEQRVAVLGDEPEQQPVDDAQQGCVQVVEPDARRRRGARAASVLAGCWRKPVPRVSRACLDAVAQQVQRADALADGGGAPPLQPAVDRRRTVGRPRRGTGGTAGRAGRSRRRARRRTSPRGRTRRRPARSGVVESRSSRSTRPLETIAHR